MWLPFLCILLALPAAYASPLPGDAARLLPVLAEEVERFWPELLPREFPAGLIEQESLWHVRAQLKTERELGCGLGQFTVAYSAGGAVRFDALAETRRLDPSLASWSWRDCHNERLQLRAVVIKLRSTDRACTVQMVDNANAKACNAAKYNGGAGSVAKRVRVCRAVAGCNHRVWEGHLAAQCPQSRVKVKGYGESFCDINSKYPSRVFARMAKYQGKIIRGG